MAIGGEWGSVQKPMVRYAQEVGWELISPEEALNLRRGEESHILWDVFLLQVQKLNPDFVDRQTAEDLGKRLTKLRPDIEGSLQAWEYLKGLKTVFHQEEKRERNVKLIDFDNPENNAFHVSYEFTFSNGRNKIRADIIFFVNGIPVLLVETKSPKREDAIGEALDQVKRYHSETPELFTLVQYYAVTNLIDFYYSASWNTSARYLMNWRDETAGRDFESRVKSFIAPKRVLKVLSDFILFTRKDGELQKVVLRPHQIRAVHKAILRCKDPKKKRGLIWHTQGSGKTYTMITIAKKLLEDPVFEDPTVLMLVDRNELETQLFGNLASTLGIEDVVVAKSIQHLKELLSSDTRGLIVSMIHKFREMLENLNTRDNMFVLIDEAHRSTGGDLGNYLMRALPNATYLGFTGTPIDKTSYGKGTFKVFGVDDPERGYLDKYSIKESIEDGTTVPLYYSLAPNELRVEREILDREFLELSESMGLSDFEGLDKVLSKAVNLKNMLKNKDRINRIAQYVAKHFTENVEPMGFKAFLVGVDRKACCMLKEALDKYLPPEYSKVVISKGHNDREWIAKYHLSEDEEKRIRKDFRDPDKLPKILIVTEKLLTGYDAPILYCMYLDKPMRDHVLLQAIARVNRPYEDEKGIHKPGGFIVDFVGIFENLEKALAFDSKDVVGVVTGVEVLKARFKNLMEGEGKDYLSVVEGKSGDKEVEAVIEHFSDDKKRKKFYEFFRELESLYEILSPDPFLDPYLEDYLKLSDMFSILRTCFEKRELPPQVKELAKKTEELVKKHTKGSEIGEVIKVYELTPENLQKLLREDVSDTVKVFNLIKSLMKEIADKSKSTPFLKSIGERAEEIAQAFKNRQITAEEALKELERLIEEKNKAYEEQAKSGLSMEAFTVGWIFKKSGIGEKQVKEVQSKIEEVFKENPYWQHSEEQRREVLRGIYKILMEMGIKDPDELKRITDTVFKILEA